MDLCCFISVAAEVHRPIVVNRASCDHDNDDDDDDDDDDGDNWSVLNPEATVNSNF